MATLAHLIIDGRQQGLPGAATYYKTFPREPSPLGDLPLGGKGSTTVMTNSSLDAALNAMATVGVGGIVVFVCHAFQQGILLPIVSTGSNALAVADNMGIIDKVIAAEAEAAVIRKLPASNATDQKVVLDRWSKFLDGLQPGAITGTFTVKEAEAFYAKWLEMVATKLEFLGNPRRHAMRQLLAKVLRVRALKLSRLELRACNLGQDKSTMEVVRKFFGADHLTAPTVGTFYVGSLPVTTVARYGEPPGRRGVLGRARVPGSLGTAMSRLAWFQSQAGHTTRGFLGEGITPGLQLGTFMPFHSFKLTVDETSAFHYRASATVISTGDGVTPDWAEVRKFVQGWIMPGSTYMSRSFPLAGLWTPDIVDLPFVLPNETSYTKLIEQVP